MTDTQRSLELTEAKLTQNSADRDKLVQSATKLGGEICDLRAKLADEQKPKLKKGDYYLDAMGDPCVKLGINDSGYTLEGNYPCKPENLVILGNLDDDLKAMAEDVTDGKQNVFVTDTGGNSVSLTVQLKICNDAVWLWSSDGSGVQLKLEKVSSLRQLLQRAEATLKRRQANG